MKFTCDKEELDKQLQHLGRIITVRHTMPVLSNLLLETDGEIVRISGTDLELALTTHIQATVKQEGSFTVPAKIFQDFIHQNPDDQIEITLEGSELICASKQVTARLAGIDPEEFPALPKVKEEQRVVVPAQAFVETMRQVVIACAADPGRPVLTGVQAEFKDNEALFVATDSFRLVEKRLQIVPVPTPLTTLIPGRSIQEVIRIVSQLPELTDIEIAVGGQQAIFKMGEIELYSRLLTGSFPKYEAIIPKTFVAFADVTSSEFLQALRLATVFSQAGVSNVMLEVSEDGTLTLASYGSQRGTTKHTLYAVLKEGYAPVKAAFNARFLLDAVSATGSEYVQLRFSGSTSPLVVGTDDAAYLQLVMPIRLDS
jgi:DNA polymerase-3 subunit beta